MDPITLIGTVSSILGGGSIFAGINLLNGHLQRKFQEAENEKQREFQRQMQDRQMEFQLALKEMDYRHGEQMQREMAELQFQNSMKLQEVAWERNVDYENVWPLKDIPKTFVKGRIKAYSYDRIPLLTLIPNSLLGKIDGIGRVIKDFYPEKGLSPVIYYDGAWKDEKTMWGNALLRSLHSVLDGVPTLVLLPNVTNHSFSLDIGFWGFGATGDMPESRTIIPEIALREIEVNLIRADADEKIALYADEKEMLQKYKNVQIRIEELARQRALKARGNADEVIDKKLRNEFFEKYSKAKDGIEAGKIAGELSSVIRMLLDVVCAAYADVYHLIESKVAPRAPLIAKENALFKHPTVRSILVGAYRAAIESLQSDEMSRILDCPLCCALVAESLHKAGWDVESAEFGRQAESMLLQLYEKPTRNIADVHRVALELLTENACVGKDSLVVQKMWWPGMRHLHYEHVFASKAVGVWSHDPGWDWKDGRGVDDLSVAWTPNASHPEVPNIHASAEVEKWLPDDGYVSIDSDDILKGVVSRREIVEFDVVRKFLGENVNFFYCGDDCFEWLKHKLSVVAPKATNVYVIARSLARSLYGAPSNLDFVSAATYGLMWGTGERKSGIEFFKRKYRDVLIKESLMDENKLMGGWLLICQTGVWFTPESGDVLSEFLTWNEITHVTHSENAIHFNNKYTARFPASPSIMPTTRRYVGQLTGDFVRQLTHGIGKLAYSCNKICNVVYDT